VGRASWAGPQGEKEREKEKEEWDGPLGKREEKREMLFKYI
jgi:hypothetical protein